MQLTSLDIHHFRNISSARIDFHSQLNLISGQNGSGKTSILEAIYFLSLGRSFRSSQLVRIIEHNNSGFQLFAKVFDERGFSIASAREKNGKSTVKLDGEVVSSQSELTQAFPVQIFNPESFNLISSGAKERCKVLDWGAFYHDVGFLKLWQQAKHLIKQRNAALKQRFPMSYIQALDQALLKKAERLDAKRQAYFALLKPKVLSILSTFSESIDLSIEYHRGWSHEKPLDEVLNSHLDADLKSGTTSYGPHRADLRFKINHHPAQDILSRGQQKLLILALKLAQGELYTSEHKKSCVYLLDDLYSELDQRHLSKVFENLLDMDAQLIATSISPEQINQYFHQQEHASFLIEQGEIK
ncbi:DNA replication/repair protein RecF [Fangia hongkongensis]|uniref:DNA replication/repair protein RecF n=1 Tax=Fangia hongkongensis TaxID=270495 RepID=UPI0003811D5F|nr:DNA replication/repair protein RecF [Fangia hongkongensis]MBK2124671.1 DNA replication/repair protein RecF [Fangia hongkongensis]